MPDGGDFRSHPDSTRSSQSSTRATRVGATATRPPRERSIQRVRVPRSRFSDPSYLGMRKIIPTIFFLALLPVVASALTVEDIKAQIQGILERIEALKTQVLTGGTSSATSLASALPA